MSMKINTGWVVIGAILALAIVSLALSPFIAKANPSLFAPTKETATATSTLAYMSPGVGTTTLTYDSLSGDSVKVDTLTVALQYTASTTSPVLRTRVEDSINNIDWYPRTFNESVTSTTSPSMTAFSYITLTLATTTDNGGSGTATRVHDSFTVTAPMRYVRVLFYVPTGGTNGGLWAQMIPVKEVQK